MLLFRGKNIGAKITRTYTGGDIDHVGMILKFDAERKEVFFLDATSNRVILIRIISIGSSDFKVEQIQTIQELLIQQVLYSSSDSL